MTRSFSPWTWSAIALACFGCTGSDYKIAGERPVIELFSAAPMAVRPSQGAVVRWSVKNASSVALSTSDGRVLRPASGELEGSHETGPLSDSVTFVLTAENAHGRSGASVEVVVLFDPPVISELIATPDHISRGNRSVIGWRTSNTESVELQSASGDVLVSAGEPVGNLEVRPAASATYTLLASGKGGTVEAQVEIVVEGTPPVIERFVALPARIVLGAASTLEWQAAGAASVQITDNFGRLIRDTSSARGAITVTPTTTTDYRLLALNMDGQDEETARVTVALAPDPPPTVPSFSVTPLVYATASRLVRVDYDARGLRGLDLTLNGAPAPGFPRFSGSLSLRNEAGSYTATISDTTVLALLASSSDDVLEKAEVVVEGVAEHEPNELASTAQVLTATAIDVRASHDDGDVDWFAIDVPADGSVEAETSFGPGRCALDSKLFLIAPDRVTPRAFDEDDGVDGCSNIDPEADTGANALPAGRYYLRVEAAPGSTGTYVLHVLVRGPACGDRVVESGEQCDDGNANAADGCDPLCHLELETPLGPGPGSVTVTIAPGAFAAVPVDVGTAGGAILAVALDPNMSSCNNVDTRLELLSPGFISLGSKSGGGPTGTAGQCAAITPPADRFSTDLAAGRHYLLVYNDGGSGPVLVGINTFAPSCGNTITESRANEQCDDGGTANGDGCSSTCQLEGLGTAESEPNNSQATADDTGLIGVGRATISGGNNPGGDDDVFRFLVPAGQVVRVQARTYSTPAMPTSCNSATTDTRIFLEREGLEASGPGTGELAYNDDIDNANNVWCSRVGSIVLSGGAAGARYFVRVQGWQDTATTSYLLDIIVTP